MYSNQENLLENSEEIKTNNSNGLNVATPSKNLTEAEVNFFLFFIFIICLLILKCLDLFQLFNYSERN